MKALPIKALPISELKPHPFSHRIYGDTYDDALLESIKDKGIIEPLLITQDKLIISGHRRFNVAKELKLKEVPIIYSDITDELDIKEAVILANQYRDKTFEQRGREYNELKIIETERAKIRMLATQKNKKGEAARETFPLQTEEKGKAADIAGKKIGLTGKSAEKLLKVVEKIDSTEKAGNKDDADDIRTALESRGIDPVYKKVVKTPKERTKRELTTQEKEKKALSLLEKVQAPIEEAFNLLLTHDGKRYPSKEVEDRLSSIQSKIDAFTAREAVVSILQ
jgi:ParB-like chromosome segregation protein Spo0J